MIVIDKTIGAVFREQAAQHGTQDFMIYPDRGLRFSWNEFEQRSEALAKGLLQLGLRRGDHLGVWARNVPDWLTLFFATAQIGVVLITVNTSYKSHELAYVLKQSDMKALAIVDGFRDVSYVDTVYALIPELRQCPRGMLVNSEFPHLKHVLFMGQEKHRGMYSMPELFQMGDQCSDAFLRDVRDSLDCDDVVNIQYTSGTTGFPKGVMLTHRNILNNGFHIGERQQFTDADRVCLPVPLFHCFGIVLGVMATLTHGGTLVMVETFDPLVTLAAVQKEKCTALYGVPTMFNTELNHP
ncbi:MAG TPA: AMP-binding protein, partial [Candidatus Hydrogenedentes bacterium]|nr:AMP-binding protein [Candidatus Hydrogenedentota bacterium]